MARPDAVAVGGAALVSALGDDWRTCCAAARAGLRRAGPVAGFEAQSEVDGEEEPATGHAATLVTHGFEGSARLLRLLAAGLRDLVHQVPDLVACESSTGFVLVLGPRDRHLDGWKLVPDTNTAAELRAAVDAARAREGGDEDGARPPSIDIDRLALLSSAAALAGIHGAPSLLHCFEEDDVSFVIALKYAARLLGEARLRRVIVLAADTLLDPDVMAWLENTGRLKASGVPVGLEPGEACAALLLERHDPSVRALGLLRTTAFGIEPQPMLAGGVSVGEGTARALSSLVGDHGWASQGVAWIVSDHNGEVYRASDLALALVRARPFCPALEHAMISVPATSFGDVGAARPALGACVALAAFERGYAPAHEAVILAVGDTNRRAAFVLTRA